jgi:hypothetical protein
MTFVILTGSIFIFFNVALPLYDINLNEIDKKKVIGLNASVPMEFENEIPFWWLVKDINTLTFHNDSDEEIKGKIVLGIESNPCNQTELLNMDFENQQQNFEIIPGKITKLIIPVEINGKSSKDIWIAFMSKVPCYIDNGDARNFGAKLKSWSFE